MGISDTGLRPVVSAGGPTGCPAAGPTSEPLTAAADGRWNRGRRFRPSWARKSCIWSAIAGRSAGGRAAGGRKSVRRESRRLAKSGRLAAAASWFQTLAGALGLHNDFYNKIKYKFNSHLWSEKNEFITSKISAYLSQCSEGFIGVAARTEKDEWYINFKGTLWRFMAYGFIIRDVALNLCVSNWLLTDFTFFLILHQNSK